MTNFGAAVSNSPYGSIQLGYDFSQSPPNGSITYATTSVTTTLTISLHAGYSVSDPSYTLSISGDWAYSGTPVAVSIPSGGGTQVLWSGTVTRSLTPGSGSSQSFSASISGLYQYNATASVGGTNYTDVRPYGTGTPTLSNASPVMGNPTMPVPVTITANRTDTTHGVRFWVSYGAFTSYIGASVGGIQWPGAGPDTMTYDFPVASLGGQIPNTTSGGGAIYCDYFDAGSAFIGTAGVAFSASIPSTVIPTLTSVTNAESGTTGVTLTGKYVQNYSAATFTITGATPQGGAGSIVSGVITVNGTPYAVAMPGLTTTLNPLPTAGTGLVVSGTVTDSRGRVSAVTAGPTIDVLAYAPPVISTFNPPSRWTGSPGAADDLGTSIQVVSAGSASVLPSSLSPAQRNSLIWKVETQPISGGSWTTQKTTTIPQGTTPTLAWSSTDLLGTVLGGGFTLAATQAYNVRLSAQDAFFTTTATLLLPVGTVTMSWSQTGVGIGKILDAGKMLDVGGQIYQNNGIAVVDTAQQTTAINAALDPRPKGTVFFAIGTAPFTDVNITGGYGFGHITFTPQAGRLYCITWNPPLTYVNTATAAAEAEIRATTDNSTPTLASAKVTFKQYHIPLVGVFVDTPVLKWNFSVGTTPANPYKFLGTIVRVAGSGTIMSRADDAAMYPWYRIDDLGLASTTSSNTVTANTG